MFMNSTTAPAGNPQHKPSEIVTDLLHRYVATLNRAEAYAALEFLQRNRVEMQASTHQ